MAEELADYKALFDLQQTRMARATERWRAEDPKGRELISPDLGDLLDWLMNRIEELESSLRDPVLREKAKVLLEHLDGQCGQYHGHLRCPWAVAVEDTL
jgi:hypothetical protein